MNRITKWAASAVALLLGVALVATPATAQTTASVDATATVIGGVQALTATGQQDLDFGTVTAGAGAVTPGESSWGRFLVTGEPSTNILVEFTTLPTELADGFVDNVHDVVSLGDMVKVKVMMVDDQGRIKLSIKRADPNFEEKKRGEVPMTNSRPTSRLGTTRWKSAKSMPNARQPPTAP